jgi:hypothetical protein
VEREDDPTAAWVQLTTTASAYTSTTYVAGHENDVQKSVLFVNFWGGGHEERITEISQTL